MMLEIKLYFCLIIDSILLIKLGDSTLIVFVDPRVILMVLG